MGGRGVLRGRKWEKWEKKGEKGRKWEKSEEKGRKGREKGRKGCYKGRTRLWTTSCCTDSGGGSEGSGVYQKFNKLKYVILNSKSSWTCRKTRSRVKEPWKQFQANISPRILRFNNSCISSSNSSYFYIVG